MVMKIIINGNEFESLPNFLRVCNVIREQRDLLLQASDWTQMPDVTLSNKTDWAVYRQELRDFVSTNQQNILDGIADNANPLVINFPTPPQE
jgi:hypothetical protein